MSLKEKVVLWQSGVENATAGKFEDAVDNFTEIPEPSARIYFNIASAFLRLGNLEDAERVRDRENEREREGGLNCDRIRETKVNFCCLCAEPRLVREKGPSHGSGLLPERLPVSSEAKVRDYHNQGI